MTKKEQELETLLSPTVAAMGLRVWGVEYLGQGKHSVLRVYIDRDDGVTIDDCESVSKQVSELLDVEDALTASYTLEVSSPGMDRLLFKPEQYAREHRRDGRREAELSVRGATSSGWLADWTRKRRGVSCRSRIPNILIPLANVQRARIVPRFE